MRAKPEIKPWEYVDKTKKSSDKERHYCALAWFVSLSGCGRGSAAPTELKKNVYQCLTQGLHPGLGRSIALIGLFA